MNPELRPKIRVARRTTPTYCTACDAGSALHITIQNPKVAGPATLALCDGHAEVLASLLKHYVDRARRLEREKAFRDSRSTTSLETQK